MLVTAGSWGDRWDFSVGSMTITSARQEVLDFTQPYYYTPAQLAAHADTGITTPEGLAGKTICMGEATSYLEWMGGTLDFGTETPTTVAAGRLHPGDSPHRPRLRAGVGPRSDRLRGLAGLVDDRGRRHRRRPAHREARATPSSIEPLAVAFDKSVADNDSLVAAVDAIVGEMHADGTLSELSQKWYGIDLTKKVGE